MLGLAVLSAVAATPALAQDASCQTNLESLAKRRVAALADLSALAKAGKGKLDPIAACPKLRGLAAIEAQFTDYMTKNKDWCGIPDNIIQSITEGHAKSVKFAAQACNVAAQVKKMQEQQQSAAAVQAPRLPAGPL